MTLSTKALHMTLNIKDSQYHWILSITGHSAKQCSAYAECVIMLNVVMAPTNVYASITKGHQNEKLLVTAKLVLFNPQVYREFGQGVNLNKNLFL
jgi:hypothetical protein